jgi:hypothetical protein
MMFAETARLRIRGFEEHDMDKLVSLINHPTIQRVMPREVLPRSSITTRNDLNQWMAKSLMFCILEAKEPTEHGVDWVGMMMLTVDGSPKNRDVEFGIALSESFQGRKLGVSLFTDS